MKIEKSNYQQSGFFCTACGSHLKTYNGLIPDHCVSCGSIGTLKMEWNQTVELTVATKQLPLINPLKPD